ncbi:hypothetical protein F4680DRAFT_445625 [Xylaria scruposa]|nr:hypothetical protein F4680DRAFT_445625 [Xylaria scruposa]
MRQVRLLYEELRALFLLGIGKLVKDVASSEERLALSLSEEQLEELPVALDLEDRGEFIGEHFQLCGKRARSFPKINRQARLPTDFCHEMRLINGIVVTAILASVFFGIWFWCWDFEGV